MAETQRAEEQGETGNKGRAAGALDTARERTLSAYESARNRTRETARDLSDQISVYPMAAVAGGLAVGALLAFLLPRTQRETQLLGATGRKLTAAARDAAQRGVEFGREKVDTLAGKAVTKVGAAVAEAVTAKD